jgi:hypothetical protein
MTSGMLSDKENQLESKLLNIKLQKDVNTFLFCALPLCMILSDEKLIPWFNEHFIEIFMQFDGRELYFGYNDTVSYGEKDFDCNNTLLSINSISYRRMIVNNINIIDLIEESIDLNKYLIIFTDEYHLPQKDSFQRQHFVHESMIYGYDKTKKILYAVAFDKTNNFSKIEYSYDAFEKAFDDGKKYYMDRKIKWIEEKAVSQIRLKEFAAPYPFDILRFTDRLKNYTYSRITNEREYYYRFSGQKDNRPFKYGIDTYDVFTEFLSDFNKGDIKKPEHIPLDIYFFQNIIICAHFLHEHKKLIHKRLKYIQEKFETSIRLCDFTEKYFNIVKTFNSIKGDLFKLAMLNDSGSSVSSSINEITFRIKSVKDAEAGLLSNILAELGLINNQI